MRAFIAIKLSYEVINEICKLQASLKNYAIRGRWTHKDNLHITLKFLGEIDVKNITKIKNSLETAVRGFAPFDVKLDKIGCFKGDSEFRVLWVGIEHNDNLEQLHYNIDEELSKVGFKIEDRAFKSHITIARNISFTIDIEEIYKISQIKSGSFLVNEIFLMESKIEDNRRKYIPLFRISFPDNIY